MNTETKNKSGAVKGIISLVVLAFVIYFFFGGGLEKQAASDMNKIENQVADDAVKQYNIAKQSGDKIDIYTHSSLVAASYLQAKDSVNYLKWKAIQKEDAKAAGMPDQQ
jgi:hypothetical protein